MFNIKEIIEPNTLDEALDMLIKNKDLKIISGGTDILINLHHKKLDNIRLVSIKNLKELQGINLLNDGTIFIGANTTFAEIFRNEIINNNIPILSEAAVAMGCPQIRNMATIGGNICNGAVSADSAPALFALNSYLKLQSKNGERVVSILDFYEGPGKVKIKTDEILVGILIKKKDYYEKIGKYIKFSTRKALDISMLGVAILVEAKKNEFIDLRVALGVAAKTPIRCLDAESYSKNKKISIETINEISKVVLNNANPRNSWRASKDYRTHLISVLTKRILKDLLLKEESELYE